jgi:hypothetical protein
MKMVNNYGSYGNARFGDADDHGNDDVDRFGNFDFSQGNLQDFEVLKKKTLEKIDQGYFQLSATTVADGITTVKRATGEIEVYPPQNAFANLESTKSLEEKKATHLNPSQPVSTEPQQEEVIVPSVQLLKTEETVKTVTTVTSRIGTAVTGASGDPEFQRMIQEHEQKMVGAQIERKLNIERTFQGQQQVVFMDNPACVAEAGDLIHAIKIIPTKSEDENAQKLSKELEDLLKSFKECKVSEERLKLIEKIKQKVAETEEYMFQTTD